MDQNNTEPRQHVSEAEPNAPDAHEFSHLNSLAHIITGSGAPYPTEGQAAPEDHPQTNNNTQADDEPGHAAKKIKIDVEGETHAVVTQQQPTDEVGVSTSTIAPTFDPQQAALAGFNAEQLAALQSVNMTTPDMIAAAMQGTTGVDGQMLPMISDLATQFIDPNNPLGQLAAGNLANLSMDAIQNLQPEQLQAFLAGQSLQNFFMPGLFGGNETNTTYKNWWDEKDEQDLMRIVTDASYRLEKLGTDELDWSKLETYFNRSQNALRKKYWMLSKGKEIGASGSQGSGGRSVSPADMQPIMPSLEQQAAAAAMAAAAAAAAAAVSPQSLGLTSSGQKNRAERKNWTEAESQDMSRIVQDPIYRAHLGLMMEGEEEISWERLGLHFNCSAQTAKRKYKHLDDQMKQGGGQLPEKGKRQHFRKSVPYRWMIVSALSKIPGLEATAPQIFENIESDAELCQQLDVRIMPGTKHVPRWKIQVRKVLSADHIFINTGVKQKHETIWRLDPLSLQDANADRQRQRAGVAPISLGVGIGGGGVGGELPAAPALVNAGTDPAVSAIMQFNEQAMAMHQHMQNIQLQMNADGSGIPGLAQMNLAGLDPASLGLDPATFAAMVANNVGAFDPQQLLAMPNNSVGGDDGSAAAAVAAAAAAMAAAANNGDESAQNAALAAAAAAWPSTLPQLNAGLGVQDHQQLKGEEQEDAGAAGTGEGTGTGTGEGEGALHQEQADAPVTDIAGHGDQEPQQ